MKRAPSSVKAVKELAEFIKSLRKGSYLEKIIRKGIATLKENMFAGKKIEKRKFPKYYIAKYGIRNLYKMNLDAHTRLIYTLVSEKTGVAVIVLEILDHKQYERRFGYR